MTDSDSFLDSLPIKRMPTIYVGYDAREHGAAAVLVDSIHRLASEPVNVVLLESLRLRRMGLYRRTPHIDSTCWGSSPLGHMADAFDERPFSTDFTFTRFLVPALNQYRGYALFMDSDMYFRRDPIEVFRMAQEDPEKALWCVQHQYDGGGIDQKMYGCPQSRYYRKNWSSFMLFNCEHSANEMLTVDDANTKPGRWLHTMSWLSEEHIGALPQEWNWLDGHSPAEMEAANVHFTTGGPWFAKKQDGSGGEWVPARDIDASYGREWEQLAARLGEGGDWSDSVLRKTA